MRKATLLREPSTDYGTFGRLTLDDGWSCRTLELPWRNNIRQKSCIPAADYRCRMVQSPRFGRVYGVAGVPDRANILIHGGNYAGNADQGYRTHVQGCILLGRGSGRLDGQPALLYSQSALREFMRRLAGQPFTLTIALVGAETALEAHGAQSR